MTVERACSHCGAQITTLVAERLHERLLVRRRRPTQTSNTAAHAVGKHRPVFRGHCRVAFAAPLAGVAPILARATIARSTPFGPVLDSPSARARGLDAGAAPAT